VGGLNGQLDLKLGAIIFIVPVSIVAGIFSVPLPAAAPRKNLHTRTVHCEGFEREDGLWDIEARLMDSKSFMFENHYRGRIEAGDLVHGMAIRVTLDLDFVIKDAVASVEDAPYLACQSTAETVAKLIGLRVGAGWMRDVRERIEARGTCTHLIGLLGPMATTAFQTMHRAIERRAIEQGNLGKPKLIDTCLALAADGDVTRIKWTEYYTGSDTTS